MKTVCYFGLFDESYSRNRVIIKGLRENGVEVKICHSTDDFKRAKDQVDTIIVGFPGHYDIFKVVILGKIYRKRVIFDIFTSKYETYVLDKNILKRFSPARTWFYLVDWLGLFLSDVLLFDTGAHQQLYRKLYNLPLNNSLVIYVGTDPEIFYPKKIKGEIDILFYGSYQPLQGIETIVKAAAALPNVKFEMVGQGQTRVEIEGMVNSMALKNVKFKSWLPYKELAMEVNKSKIMLGIFGSSLKAQSVIPNKVYDGLACQKAVVTEDSPAVRELLNDSENCLLVKPGDPDELVGAIKKLLSNISAREKIAQKGYNLFTSKLTPKEVVKGLINIL